MKILSILLLTFTLTNAKNPAFILYDDGTWEKAGGASLDLSSYSTGNSSMGSLEVVAMVTMQLGGAKPVSSEDIFLLTKSVAEMCRAKGLNPYESFSYVRSYSLAVTAPIDYMMPYLQAVREGLQNFKVAEEITELNGKAEFFGVKPGNYYVLLRTSLPTHGAVWCVPVQIKAGRNKIILRNANLNKDLFHDGESFSDSPTPTSTFAPSPPSKTLTYESERMGILSRHENKQISNKEAILELIALKEKYGK